MSSKVLLIMDGNIDQDIIRIQKATEVVDEGDIVQGQPRKSSPRKETHGTSPRGGEEKRVSTSKTKKQQPEKLEETRKVQLH